MRQGSGSDAQAAGQCPLFKRTLKRGFKDRADSHEVKILQEFLARFPEIYPEGLVTGYFGILTERATRRFQTRQRIIDYGEPETTGFGVVGPRTRAAIKEL